jgi:acyl-ACP thioesterase
MHYYPRWQDEIVVETWPRKPEHLFAFRDYQIKNDAGETLGAATSTWMVLDAVKRRPQRLDLVENMQNLTLEKKILATDAHKITLPLSMPVIGEISVKYNDIDFNGHVTNTRYVEWCLDLFDHNFHSKHYLAELQINFLQESSFDDELILKMASAGDTKFIVVATNKKTGKNIFAAELIWLSY